MVMVSANCHCCQLSAVPVLQNSAHTSHGHEMAPEAVPMEHKASHPLESSGEERAEECVQTGACVGEGRLCGSYLPGSCVPFSCIYVRFPLVCPPLSAWIRTEPELPPVCGLSLQRGYCSDFPGRAAPVPAAACVSGARCAACI